MITPTTGKQPEAISSGKVYFTRCYFSLGRAARQKDYLPFEINLRGGSFFAMLIFMIFIKSPAKTRAKHGIGRTEEAQTPLSKTRENKAI
ncbi:MAG: hypothetical protein Q7U83_00710 [Daejeonella sp.]|nr:hypothetical protein [Daejeonella sp.]